MITTNAEFYFEQDINGDEILKHLEKVARICYKSENKISDATAKEFVKRLITSEHETMIEHYSITVRIVCDRGVSHEIVRHRIASYAQESTVNCNYSKEKFRNSITVIKPIFWEDGSECMRVWETAMCEAEKAYMKLIELGAEPKHARSVLPNSLKTELLVTMNLRGWRNFFKQRTSESNHPQMLELTIPLLAAFKEKIPVVFDDL